MKGAFALQTLCAEKAISEKRESPCLFFTKSFSISFFKGEFFMVVRLFSICFIACSFMCSLRADELCLSGLAIQYDRGALRVLDQQKLPAEEEWIVVETPQQMVEIITSLKVRGAPLIGIAAILSLAQLAEKGEPAAVIEGAAQLLRKSRPTAVNLAHYIDRVLLAMKKGDDVRESVVQTVAEIFHEDTALCKSMGEEGAAIIQEGEHILTYCNTGSLATAGIGTALGVIKTAHAQGKKIHVYACETRSFARRQVDCLGVGAKWHSLHAICDNMAAVAHG